ncbi:MAG: hypothetical protein C5B52_01770 [Bacteroidetes bacterium]|nr:MAG: hypothetical protein C5B52_01770 [Bacteroidota bacterium]
MIRLVMFVVLLTPIIIYAQENVPPAVQENMEEKAEAAGESSRDDSWNQQFDQLSRHRVNLNHCGETELTEISFLDPLQIQVFLKYRELLGPLIDIHELQAIPGWDLETIQKVIPFVSLDNSPPNIPFFQRFRHGESKLIFRVTSAVEKWSGNSNTGYYYLGDPIASNLRYKYQFKNLLQFGITGDKDAGEKFGFGPGSFGFDFYSLHLYARFPGFLKSFALGDYTINMGQGLVMWQGLAMGFGSDITQIKRQSETLRPYTSSGEFNFQRGAAASFAFKSWESTAFLSFRKVDGNQVEDSISGTITISSILEGGYHRTFGELHDKGTLGLFSAGGNLKYRRRLFSIGLNGLVYSFDKPIHKTGQPYNLFAFRGKEGAGFSLNYDFTIGNTHVFGEWAMDQYLHKAFVSGLLMGLGQPMDLSLLIRSLSPEYQSLYSYPLAESSSGNNENGVFVGLALRLGSKWKLNISQDFYRYPWLRYGISAPVYGNSSMFTLDWHLDKTTQVTFNTRYSGTGKNSVSFQGIPIIANQGKFDLRFQTSFQLTRELSMRFRLEYLTFSGSDFGSQKAYLVYSDFFFKPLIRNYTLNLRLQSFDADSYNSRLYSYENDVLYYNYIPFFYGRGLHYYINLKLKPAKSIGIWLKWSQTFILEAGESQNTLAGAAKRKSEIRILSTFNF